MVVIFVFIIFLMIVVVLGLCAAFLIINFAVSLLLWLASLSARILVGGEPEKTPEQVHREQY